MVTVVWTLLMLMLMSGDVRVVDGFSSPSRPSFWVRTTPPRPSSSAVWMAKKKKKNKNLNKKRKKEQQQQQPAEEPVEDDTKEEVVSEAVDILEAMAATLGQPASTHPPEVLIKADENDVSIPYDAAAFLAYDGVVEENVDYATFRAEYEANAVAEVIAKRQQQQSTTKAPAATSPAPAASPIPPPVDTAAVGTPTTTTTTPPPQIASSADEAAIADVGDRAYLILQDLGVF